MFDNEEEDQHAELQGYTPPEDRRRRGLHRKNQVGPSIHSGPILMVVFGIAALILLVWFLYNIAQERRKMLEETNDTLGFRIERVIDVDPDHNSASVFSQV